MHLSVSISAYFKESLNPILIISRFLGLLPFYISYDKAKHVHKLKFSDFFAILGCILGLSLSGLLIYDFINVLKDRKQIATAIDKYFPIVDACLVTICLLVSIFVIILRRQVMLQFVHHLSLVDDMLHLKNSHRLMHQSLLIITVTTVVMLGFFSSTFYVYQYIMSSQLSLYQALLKYIPLYFSYYLIVIETLIYLGIAQGLSKRLYAVKIEITAQQTSVLVKNQFPNEKNWYAEGITQVHLARMVQLYELLIEALDMFNQLFGPAILTQLTNILINLIVLPYFVTQHLMKDKALALTLSYCGSVLFQVSRLILIVEPAHLLDEELEGIKVTIRKLLSQELKQYAEEQAEIFAKKMLILSPTAFQPCGMFSVTRGVYTWVLQSVITYVVILINLQN